MGMKSHHLNLISLSRSPGGQINEPLHDVPERIDADPCNLAGLLIKYSGTIKQDSADGAVNVSQREIARSLGKISVTGGGYKFANSQHGDAWLIGQYLGSLATSWAKGTMGVCEEQEAVDLQGAAVTHTVYVPTGCLKAAQVAELGKASRWDGSIPGAVAAKKLQLGLTEIGLDSELPDNCVWDGDISVTVDGLVCWGDEIITPYDTRFMEIAGVRSRDPFSTGLGGLREIIALGVMSESVPTFENGSGIQVEPRIDTQKYRLSVDDTVVRNAHGYMWPRHLTLIGRGDIGHNTAGETGSDEPETWAALVLAAETPMATNRYKGSRLQLEGWRDNQQTDVALIGWTRGLVDDDQSDDVEDLTGVRFDEQEPEVGGNPAGEAGLSGSSGIGVSAVYRPPAKR